MTDIQAAKKIVLDAYAAIENAAPSDLGSALEPYYAASALWRGFHPFHEITGHTEVARQFWYPLRRSLDRMQRRMDIFIAGPNALDEGKSIWVASMGHLMGNFKLAWLGIAPTNKIAMLRYAEFNCIRDGQIVGTAMFFDIPHLMMQAGLNPFPPQTGAHLVQPGPATHDGLHFDAASPDTGRQTLATIDRMIDDLRTWRDTGPDLDDIIAGLEEELPRSWTDDMIWWGPAGIGASYTVAGYARQHSGPFRAGFADRMFNGHIAKIAEGNFGGFFGWPNLTLRPSGGFMGMPATGKAAEMRVIDMYRRDGDKLAENWIFIDLLHFWNQQGVDILGRMADHPRT